MDEIWTATVFVLVYLGIAFGGVPGLTLDRTGVALLGAIAIIAGERMTTDQAAALVDLPTLALLYALMIFSAQLSLAGFYTRLAAALTMWLGAPGRFLAGLMVAAAGLSALLSNDIVCLAFAPVIAQACLTTRTNPMPHLLGLAFAANIGSAATVIGNPQNMLVGQLGGLDFAAFSAWALPPTVLSLVAAFAVLWWRYRVELGQQPAGAVDRERLLAVGPPFDRWQSGKGLVLLAVLVALFFTDLPRALAALGLAALLLLSRRLHTRSMLALIDWHLLTLFAALFVVVGAFARTGLPSAAIDWLAAHGLPLNDGTVLALIAAALSNLVGNVPATMLLAHFLDPAATHAWYVLALASTFAGNLLLIGSIANLIVAEQAAARGIALGFAEYARAGVPVTAASLAVLLVWLQLAG